MRKKVVLHFSANRYPALPTEHHTLNIWRELSLGFDEYHVFARAQGMRFSNTRLGNIHLHLIPSFGARSWVFFFTSWLALFYLARVRPTHVIAQCPVLGGLAASVVAGVSRSVLFVELHGAHYFRLIEESARHRMLRRLYFPFASMVFSVASRIRSLSDDMTDSLCHTYGDHLRSKVIVIPTRVDLTRFGTVKGDYKVGGLLKLITVGAITPGKNHVQLLKDLVAIGRPFRLLIVGEGPSRSLLENTIRDLGCKDNVTLSGTLSQDRVAQALVESDIYIHYSLTEGLPRAVLEAMAVGLPVVATRAGFIKGIIVDHENALLLDSASSKCLTPALESLATSEATREKLGYAARLTVTTRFDSKIVFENYRNAVLSAPLGFGSTS